MLCLGHHARVSMQGRESQNQLQLQHLQQVEAEHHIEWLEKAILPFSSKSLYDAKECT